MHIGLIGMPGAGKTLLAEAIEAQLVKGDGECEDCNTPVGIVDNYAEDISKRGDWAIGMDGGYMANIAIAIERYNRERVAIQNNKTTVTCGTVLESAVYAAMKFEVMSEFLSTDEEKLMQSRRIEATLKTFACMYMDAFPYTRLFYLPRIIPQENEDTRMAKFDQNIQASFQSFAVPVEPLMFEGEGDATSITKKRLARIFTTKEEYESQSAGTGTRSSGSE